MCLSVFAYKVHPKYPFIFASNRDEFYKRPAQPATFWYDHPTLLAGRDLEAGGTWLGVTKENKFAALTNYRDISNIIENAPSRGNIVTNFLTSGITAPEFMGDLKNEEPLYNGFNLIAGTFDNLWYYNNQNKSIIEIEPGYHSLSNAFLDTPWPKTEKALSDFKSVTETGSNLKTEEIFDLLQNKERFPDETLPSTGLSIEMERIVSSIFITSENYGTRCSTLVCHDDDGITSFDERTYNPETLEIEVTARYKF